jgi:hypothetical protein
VLDPIRHTFTEQGLQIGTRTLDSELKWSGMHSVKETPTWFLFHYNRRLAYYLPKRVLATPQEVDELSGWIRKRLPPATPYNLLDSKG